MTHANFMTHTVMFTPILRFIKMTTLEWTKNIDKMLMMSGYRTAGMDFLFSLRLKLIIITQCTSYLLVK